MTRVEIKAYSQWLIDAKDSDSIYEKLTEIKDDLIARNVLNFQQVLEEVIAYIEEELKAAKDLKLTNEIEHINLVIETIKDFMGTEELDGEELTSEDLKPNKLVFAKTSSGNYFIEVDLKDIKFSDEVYIKIKQLIKFIESGRRTNNQAITRKLTNNNYNDIIEYKNRQVRIYTKQVLENVICIIGIRIKKGDNPKSIQSFLSNREKALTLNNTIKKLKETLLSDKRDTLLEEGRQELDKIMIFLDSKGKNKEITINPASLAPTKEVPQVQEKITVNDELDPAWKRNYEIAKHIFETKGTINVRLTYTFNNYNFGRWVKNQKDAYKKGKLSDLQIKLLEDLDIAWYYDVNNPVTRVPRSIEASPVIKNKLYRKWLENYNLAKQFYEENGHLRIKMSYVVQNVKLGIWIRNQRYLHSKGKLSEDRVNLLNQIGMIWAIYKPAKQVEILSLEPEHDKDRDAVMTSINASLETLDLNSLKRVEKVIKQTRTNVEIEKQIIGIYQGLLGMSEEQLNEFILRVENDDLTKIGKSK